MMKVPHIVHVKRRTGRRRCGVTLRAPLPNTGLLSRKKKMSQLIQRSHVFGLEPRCQKIRIILLKYVGRIFLVRSSYPTSSHASLFNICSSCGGLYLEVLLGKPAHNVYQM